MKITHKKLSKTIAGMPYGCIFFEAFSGPPAGLETAWLKPYFATFKLHS
jgi:hypothetical protein